MRDANRRGSSRYLAHWRIQVGIFISLCAAGSLLVSREPAFPRARSFPWDRLAEGARKRAHRGRGDPRWAQGDCIVWRTIPQKDRLAGAEIPVNLDKVCF